MFQRIEGRSDHVVRIGRTERFCDHILHPEGFEYRTHRSAGDDAGAGRSRAQEDAARAVTAANVMMKRAAFPERYADQASFRRFGGLANCFGHLACLAVPEADSA